MARLDRQPRAPLRRSLVTLLCGLAVVACDRPERKPPPPTSTESDHQVRRLREDTEIELQDLRGRWLAFEGLLTRQRDTLRDVLARQEQDEDQLRQEVARLDVALGAMSAELALLRELATRPEPPDDTLARLARSYEEIYCLRRQGAEESVGAVYPRYGFSSAEAWAEAWQRAARSESFEREVASRVERLCP